MRMRQNHRAETRGREPRVHGRPHATGIAATPLLAIFAMMSAALALALCSTTDAFIAATSFPGFPMTAKLAFLVFGPMFDLKLYWLYGLLFKRRVVVLLGLGLFAGIGLICWRLQALGF